MELGVTVGEDPAVGRHQPVAPPSGVAAMPTIGLSSGCPPIDPKNGASPKAKTPPSDATSW